MSVMTNGWVKCPNAIPVFVTWALLAVCVWTGVSTSSNASQPAIEQRLLVLLVNTPKAPLEPEQMKKLQQEHLENLRRMAEAGHLLVAGPTRPGQVSETSIAGILIFKSDSVETQQEIESMLTEDPKIKAGFIRAESYSMFFENGDNLYERLPRGVRHGTN